MSPVPVPFNQWITIFYVHDEIFPLFLACFFQVGDIGLMGAPARVDKKAVEGVNIFLGGGVGETHGLGEVAMRGIPAADESLVPVLRDICIEKFGAVLKDSAAQ